MLQTIQTLQRVLIQTIGEENKNTTGLLSKESLGTTFSTNSFHKNTAFEISQKFLRGFSFGKIVQNASVTRFEDSHDMMVPEKDTSCCNKLTEGSQI